jgi:hypothetical protein
MLSMLALLPTNAGARGPPVLPSHAHPPKRIKVAHRAQRLTMVIETSQSTPCFGLLARRGERGRCQQSWCRAGHAPALLLSNCHQVPSLLSRGHAAHHRFVLATQNCTSLTIQVALGFVLQNEYFWEPVISYYDTSFYKNRRQPQAATTSYVVATRGIAPSARAAWTIRGQVQVALAGSGSR